MGNIQNQNEELWLKHENKIDSMIKSTVGYSKKNLLVNPCNNATVQGITFTANSDKSFTLSGTNDGTGATQYYFIQPLEKGKYIANGCPSGGSDSSYWMYVSVDNTVLGYDYGEGIEFELTEDADVTYCMRVANGYTVPSNVVFKPMIRYASIQDDTYEPYVADVQTQLDNSKINNSTASLINTNLSASENAQTITINNYNNYNGLYIVFRPSGDMSNGEHFFVPKCLFGMSIPFTVDSNHNFDDVYTCRTHGYVKDGVINFNKLKCKGWTFMQVLVIGLK